MKYSYGVQMFGLRDLTAVDMQKALKSVAKMGFRYVEFAGFADHSAEQIKEWLDAYGLIASSTHTALACLADDRIEATIQDHKTIGCNLLVVPGADWSTQEKMDANLALLNRAQKRLAEEGITLGYHNHSSEFFATPYGKLIEDEIIDKTSVKLEIDTFWLYNSGNEPIPYLEKEKGRLCAIHLKDGIVNGEDQKNFAQAHDGVLPRSLGMGDAPVKAVRDWAIANGILTVVESEGCNPTGLEETQRCADYLLSLEQS